MTPEEKLITFFLFKTIIKILNEKIINIILISFLYLILQL